LIKEDSFVANTIDSNSEPNVKKFSFKPAGQVSVSNIIKKVGIFNQDEEENAQ